MSRGLGPLQLKLLAALLAHSQEVSLEVLASFAAGCTPISEPGCRMAGLRAGVKYVATAAPLVHSGGASGCKAIVHRDQPSQEPRAVCVGRDGERSALCGLSAVKRAIVTLEATRLGSVAKAFSLLRYGAFCPAD